jgi:hypothetical protein
MMGPRNVQPDELGDADGMDVQDAMRVGNRLNEAMDEVPITTREGFSDRVMTALAGEPTPGTTGFLAPLRRRGFLAGLGESVRQAWASVGSGRPMLGRSAALAYVLAVLIAGISVAGAATVGTAGALGLFDPPSTPSPAPTTPAPTAPPVTTAPPPSIPPTPSPSPNMSEPPDGPTPSPTQTDDGPEASDDHGGNSGPGGGGDDNSGPGSDDDGAGSGGNSGPGSGSGSDDSSSGTGSISGSGSDDSGRR